MVEVIVTLIIGLIVGGIIGFLIARKQFIKYQKENPPINEKMIRDLYAQMGRKPSEKQIRQILAKTYGETDKK